MAPKGRHTHVYIHLNTQATVHIYILPHEERKQERKKGKEERRKEGRREGEKGGGGRESGKYNLRDIDREAGREMKMSVLAFPQKLCLNWACHPDLIDSQFCSSRVGPKN